jgi:hypothetical protein
MLDSVRLPGMRHAGDGVKAAIGQRRAGIYRIVVYIHRFNPRSKLSVTFHQ